MNTRSVIKQILLISLWIAIGGGLISLLLAANSRKKREQCSGYVVNIIGKKDNLFVAQKDVLQVINSVLKGEIKGSQMVDFNLHVMETQLEKNKWIRDAELWFDNRNILHVRVKERSPVARVFTESGGSFYIDSSLTMMPLSENVNIRIPVFTGFPEIKKLKKADSILLRQVKDIATFISADDFWKAQVMQIDIADGQTFEMIPAIGNHIVKLGTSDDLEKKFRRLWIFYEQVLSKTGMNKYSVIDVQYKGQVVGLKRGTREPVVDKGKLKQKVNELLKSSAMIKENNDAYIKPGKKQEPKPDSVVVPPATIPTDPNAVKTIIQPDTLENKIPKALMQRRNDE